MTTVRFKFRPSIIDGRPGTVYYRITRKRQTKVFASNIRVESMYWKSGRPLSARLSARIESDISYLERIIDLRAKENPDFCLDDVVVSFRCGSVGEGLLAFMSECMADLEREHRYGTARNYKSTMRSVAAFCCGCEVKLHLIDEAWLSAYQSWLKEKGVSGNTISFYMRCLKAVYHKAEECGKVAGRKVFGDVYTGSETTGKRAVSADVVRRLLRLDLSGNGNLEFARDIFIFSVLTRGMAFVDIAYLRMEDIRDGVLFYRRRKTGQHLRVVLSSLALSIVAKYHQQDARWLFPIIDSEDERIAYMEYRHGIDRYNRHLRHLGEMLGMEGKLTSYVARHSWATIVHKKNVPVSVISAALGHTSEKTTRIYLAEIDDNEIDAANRLVTEEIY